MIFYTTEVKDKKLQTSTGIKLTIILAFFFMVHKNPYMCDTKILTGYLHTRFLGGSDDIVVCIANS